jgi:hypothetical protein
MGNMLTAWAMQRMLLLLTLAVLSGIACASTRTVSINDEFPMFELVGIIPQSPARVVITLKSSDPPAVSLGESSEALVGSPSGRHPEE